MKSKLLLFYSVFILILNNSSAQHFGPAFSGLTYQGVRQMTVDTSRNLLYLTGYFWVINGDSIAGIASYDGVNVDTIGVDTNCCSSPNNGWSVGMYGNDLYAGGDWSSLDNKRFPLLARWNGLKWDSVPGWVDSVDFSNQYNLPFCFLEHDNALYVGGRFFRIGNPLGVDVAKWDGNQWTGYETGLDTITTPEILALAFYNNQLWFAGCCLGYVDSNNNSHWAPGVSLGLNQGYNALAVYHNELYVGGGFSQSNGNAGNNIMKWDGSAWHDVGGGIDGGNGYGVWGLTVYKDNLYACGRFTVAGGVSASCIARWDGLSWHGLSTDIFNTYIWNMAFYRNELYVATGPQFNYVAKYDGVLPNGINEISSFNFSLTPNPTSTNFSIHFSSPLKNTATLMLTNTLGQTVASYSLNRGEVKKEEDISGLARGVYFMVLQTEEGRVVRKVVKE